MAIADYFLKLKGVEGESTDSKHKNEIELDSFSWGEQQSGSHGGSGGKVAMQDFHFVMRVNKASPKLFKACASGEPIDEAVLTCRKAGKEQQEYLIYKFSNALVTAYHTGGSAGNEIVPMDEVSLSFGKIEVEYKEMKDGKPGGSIKAGYDLKGNKAF